MSEPRRVYCIHCQQTFLCDETEKCPLCRAVGGLLDPMSPEAVRDRTARERKQEAKDEQLEQVFSQGRAIFSRTVALFKLTLAGVVILTLGFWLVFDPTTHSNPGNLSLSDLLPGIGALVVGVVLLVLVVYFLWNCTPSQNRGSRAEPNSASPQEDYAGPISQPKK